MSKYMIDEGYIEKYAGQIGQAQPVKLEVMDVDNRYWMAVKAILSREPIEGGEIATIHNTISGMPKGEIYIKVLEELDAEDEWPHARPSHSAMPKGRDG